MGLEIETVSVFREGRKDKGHGLPGATNGEQAATTEQLWVAAQDGD